MSDCNSLPLATIVVFEVPLSATSSVSHPCPAMMIWYRVRSHQHTPLQYALVLCLSSPPHHQHHKVNDLECFSQTIVVLAVHSQYVVVTTEDPSFLSHSHRWICTVLYVIETLEEWYHCRLSGPRASNEGSGCVGGNIQCETVQNFNIWSRGVGR